CLEGGAHGGEGGFEVAVRSASDCRRAGGGCDESEEHAEGRGFSGAVGAEEPGDFPGVDREAEVVDGLHGPEGLTESANINCCASCHRTILSCQGSSVQSTGGAFWALRASFARLNGREPKKPPEADSGLGCAERITGLLFSSGSSAPASLPHKIDTSGASRA